MSTPSRIASNSGNAPSALRPAIKLAPSMEAIEDKEQETNAHLIETIAKIQTKVSDDTGHAMRGVHAKCHGVLIGSLMVLDNLPPELAPTDKAPALKKALSTVMRGAEKIVESVGGKSATLMTLGGCPEENNPGDDFYSQVPILYGDYIAKLAVKPFSSALRDLSKSPVDLKNEPDGIRKAVVAFYGNSEGEWDLQVQLCTNLASTPIEDAAKPWPEDESPYQSVARISMPPQDAWSPARLKAVNDQMSFSPWHALAAHRPLGAVNRVRKTVYEAAVRFRAEHNHQAICEPRGVADYSSPPRHSYIGAM